MLDPRTPTSVDHSTFTLTFARTIAASPADIFDAWTKPDEISQWWDPEGVPLQQCTIDLRVGGAFSFVNRGHSPPFTGFYRVIERPSLLVFDAMGAVGTVRLDADGAERTRMTVTIRCSGREHLEQFMKLGIAAGTERTLDNLVAHAARRR